MQNDKQKARVHFKNKGRYNQQRIIDSLKRRIKKKFGYTPKDSQIKKVWRDYCKYFVADELAKNEVVYLDKKNRLFVVGEVIKEGTTAFRLMKEGKILRGDKIVKANSISLRHMGIKYKIHFEHLANPRNDVYFHSNPKLSNTIHRALKNTMVNYSIKQ